MSDREKQRHYREIKSPEPAFTRTPKVAGAPQDPEKGWTEDERCSSRGTSGGDNDTAAAANVWPDMLEDDDQPDEGLFKVLLYLSLPNPFLAFLLSIYTLLSTVIIILLSPITCFLLKDKPPLPGQIIRAIAPIVRFHLRIIDSDYLQTENIALASSAKRLLLSSAVSPGVAAAISVSGWVAAAFWIYASIIGEPTGSGRPGRETEGKRAIRWVRDTWERWLVWSLR